MSQYLRERDRAYVPWEDFGDVQAFLARRWGLAAGPETRAQSQLIR
ncbi:MAG: hypothetical protein HC824_20285 [Synechococcales cyanobacterium RM1_1_8]|nr:hypothetical protein [Synechococcales cyanobacterium RM1_1_8]